MVREDIERLFDLLKIYFPNSRKTGDKQLQAAWLRLLEPYSPETVQKAVTDALRGNVNFPDPQKIAVLCETAEPAPKELAAPVDYQRRYGETAWMAPYISKMAANISREDAEEIHAAGLLTWGEAEKQGISFRDWSRKYREKFPVGFPENLRAVKLKNRCMDLPGSPFVKAEKKRNIPPKPEDKPIPAPREKLAAAVSLGTGRSREEVLAALRMGKETSHESQNLHERF